MIENIKRKLAILAAALAMPVLAFAPVAYAAHVSLVTPGDLALDGNSWYFYDDSTNTPTTTETVNHLFVDGPADPALGVGSLRFVATDSNDRWNIATNQFAGMTLDETTELAFDMFAPTESAGGADTTLFFNIDVDFDTTLAGQYYKEGPPESTYQNRLVYVPQDNDTVQLDTWQTWDVTAPGALWMWSGLGGNGGEWPDGDTDALRTWEEITTAFPNLAVWNEGATGQILVRAGHPGPVGLIGYTDNIVVNDTAYNFELLNYVDNKEECKGGGWQNGMQSGVHFKNQGQCVSFFAKQQRGNPLSLFMNWLF